MSRCAASLECCLEGPRRGVEPTSGGPARLWARCREKGSPKLSHFPQVLNTTCHILSYFVTSCCYFHWAFFSYFGQSSHSGQFSLRLSQAISPWVGLIRHVFLHERWAPRTSTWWASSRWRMWLKNSSRTECHITRVKAHIPQIYHWLVISGHPADLSILCRRSRKTSKTKATRWRERAPYAVPWHLHTDHTLSYIVSVIRLIFDEPYWDFQISQWLLRRVGFTFCICFSVLGLGSLRVFMWRMFEPATHSLIRHEIPVHGVPAQRSRRQDMQIACEMRVSILKNILLNSLWNIQVPDFEKEGILF